jgi:anion-transporting  ArsA/GET3 family ATPase
VTASVLKQIVATRHVVLCTGPGGVGKTTAAAALALAAARAGRRTVVVTIDPARRLADALGLSELGNQPSRVEGVGPGELWAMMLDPKATFDDLVRRYAATDTQRDRILSNGFYRNVSEKLSGTHEYMAAEKLYELANDPRFDLVVVDTPPSRHALDMLEAPERLARFLDHRVYRTLVAPTRTYLKVANVAAQAMVKTLSKVVGGEVISDAVSFFQAFEGIDVGFRERAKQVSSLLNDEATAYVLVTAPRADRLVETTWLAQHLVSRKVRPVCVVVNRSHPAPVSSAAAGLTAAVRQNLDELGRVAESEAALVAPLAETVNAPMVRVPLLVRDVRDLDGLDEVARHLVGR